MKLKQDDAFGSNEMETVFLSACYLFFGADFATLFAVVVGTEGGDFFLLLVDRFGCDREEVSLFEIGFAIVTDFGLREKL